MSKWQEQLPAYAQVVIPAAENIQLLQMCLDVPLHSKDLMGLMTCLEVCLLLVLETHSATLIISEKHRNTWVEKQHITDWCTWSTVCMTPMNVT